MKKISKKTVWPRFLSRKWLNEQSGIEEFNSDNFATAKTERRKSCSDKDYYVYVQEDFSDEDINGGLKSSIVETVPANNSLNLRMFVGTWNVGGKSPHDGLNLEDQLNADAPADIYVLGFQEIVPLNAGNIFGTEDSVPAAKWLSLIQQTLNNDRTEQEGSESGESPGEPKDSSLTWADQQACPKPRYSFSEFISLEDELGAEKFDRLSSRGSNRSSDDGDFSSSPKRSKYCLVASKQMVGIFLCMWVREDLCKHISNVKISSVGCGIMGYLGNKGSVSISMTLHQTTFCFVCTHLTSGEKEGDEIRRNIDVSEILKRTRFPHSRRNLQQLFAPETILEHDNIIWLGDLNYRLAPGYGDTHELLKKNDWEALMEKDQLKREQRAGRVFNGWEEGRIYFAPTYKYVANSEYYVAQTSKKRRTPAWCDRILWRGQGLEQLSYIRGESKFSDHRPVFSMFSVHVNQSSPPIKQKTNAKSTKKLLSSTNSVLQSTCVAKIQAEELLIIPRQQTSTEVTAPIL